MNRLQYETSPYLQQHKDNPVDWYPWGDEAFRRAKELDRPILLSIGYSACHWCHVMAHESFENPAIASLMNEKFVNVKVDREERPDIDSLYMNFVQITTGSGGWPLTVFLTPELIPFYGGTYFPPEEKYGRPGFVQILNAISEIFRTRKDDILNQTPGILDALSKASEFKKNKNIFTLPDFNSVFTVILNDYDEEYGGFGRAPKFPSAMTLMFLLRYASRTENKVALEMVENSLKKMAHGGIYDQIGGGFHRYSTDSEWLVPHFEKMLYDNALLSRTYLEAYQLRHNGFFLKIAEDTLSYVIREMTDSSGGFYSAQDADTEGVEGKFFLWDYDELKNILSGVEFEAALKFFGISKKGNFEGKNILTSHVTIDELSLQLGITPTQAESIISSIRAKLFASREKRVKPGLDGKILVNWNALMLQAFALAYGVTGNEKYLNAARKNGDFIWNNCFKENTLLHAFKDGEMKSPGFLDDYSFTLEAFISLYEVTAEEVWLERADTLCEIMIENFYDPASYDFYFAPRESPGLILRTKELYDQAIPSGNSSAVTALLKLAVFSNKQRFAEIARMDYSYMHDLLIKHPESFSYMLSAVYYDFMKPREVAVVTNTELEMKEVIRLFFSEFFPFSILSCRTEGSQAKIELQKGKRVIEGKITYYICQNYTCRRPVFSFEELKEAMRDLNILE
ncbi:MAG TPA: thioredoxin domain-containing protein [Ignavibacteriales bacterium]|nr:thioredoxin domain-containing protein [Ignavibacteriales bacterium]